MNINIVQTSKEAAAQAAIKGGDIICSAQRHQKKVRIILATGTSQFLVLENLIKNPGINWRNCEIFHLDEYIGLTSNHPASFVRFIKERFISKVPPVAHFEYINGASTNLEQELLRLNKSISTNAIDIAFVGIGENAHIAFNDPPADFQTNTPFIRVSLDQKCREQQVGEGWFNRLADVPLEAITIIIKQILKSKSIICTVLEDRKATAVKEAIEGPHSNLCPASALKRHPNTHYFFDSDAAGQLS